jgi:cysteine desulfurase
VAYLDHAATTPMRPEAIEAMLPWLTERYGNPSGGHAVARAARGAVDEARDTVATALGCRPGEIVFTGGGTEADNLAVAGVVGAHGGTALGSAVEHPAVLRAVEAAGGRTVAVDGAGLVDLRSLDAALDTDVALVAVMLVNNEVGTVQPVDEVVTRVRERAPEAFVLTDAVQAFPWLDVARLAAGGAPRGGCAPNGGGPSWP